MSLADNGSHSEERTSSWFTRSVYFSLIVAVAALLYLVSGSVVFGVLWPCLYAGYETLRTGVWILRTDPQRFRARTCFTFYVAAACWKAAAAALISLLAFVLVTPTARDPNMEHFSICMLVFLTGVTLNMILGTAATIAALKGRIRVWVHPCLQSLLQNDLRRASQEKPNNRVMNHAVFIIGTAVVLPLTCLGGTLAALLFFAVINVENLGSLATSISAVISVIVFPLAAIPSYAWLSARIIARSPAECWPTERPIPEDPWFLAGRWVSPEAPDQLSDPY